MFSMPLAIVMPVTATGPHAYPSRRPGKLSALGLQLASRRLLQIKRPTHYA